METLSAQLAARGYRGRIVAIHHLYDLQEEIEEHRRQGRLDEKLYQEHMAGLGFCPPDSLPGAQSVIVVAVPQPRVRFIFTWHSQPLPLVVPPTYLHWREAEKHIQSLLTDILNAQGYQVTPASLPEKLLAVRSGLGVYGRNNLCYVVGLGSFHRPVALYSDVPCLTDLWYDLEMLERCQTCVACQSSCPTGAITADRFLLRADRCLTLHNERPAEEPFPQWLDPAWHNCLVGCLCCQKACPENRHIWSWVVEGALFTEEETALLWEGVPIDQLPDDLVRKLRQSDLVDLLETLPRNLGAFLEVA